MEGLEDFLNNAFSTMENKEKKSKRRRLSSISIDKNLQNKKKQYNIKSTDNKDEVASKKKVEEEIAFSDNNKIINNNTISKSVIKESSINKNSALSNINDDKKLFSNFVNVITKENLYTPLTTVQNNNCEANINNSKESLNHSKLKKQNHNTIKHILLPHFPNEQVFDNEVNDTKNFLLDKFIAQSEKEKEKKIKKKRVSDKFSEVKENLKASKLDFNKLKEINALWLGYIKELFTFEVGNLGKKLSSVDLDDAFIIKNSEGLLMKLLKSDYTGAYITVIDSVNKNNLKSEGIVIYETKNAFFILNNKNKFKTLLKKGSVFKIPLFDFSNWKRNENDSRDIEGNILGSNINSKSKMEIEVETSNNSSANLNNINEKKCFVGNNFVYLFGDNFLFKSTERTKAKFKKGY